MKNLILSAAFITFAAPSFADIAVYPGCTAPPANSGQTWYVDSVNGKTAANGGNGSQAAPWDSLRALTGAKGSNGVYGPIAGYTGPLLSTVKEGKGGGTGPIHPGDTVMLMTGNYGDFGVGDYKSPVVNTEWVTVKAAPGQSPVVNTISLGPTNKWSLEGIKVQSLWGTNNNKAALITVSDQGAAFPTSDIILTNIDASSADDVSAWTQEQMRAQERLGLYIHGSAGNGTNGEPYTSCISMTGSHIHNVKTGATLTGNSVLFSGNEIDHQSDDGLLYGGNNLAITKNYIHDNQDNGDGNHEDAMQGIIGVPVVGVPFNTYSNILIDSNKIIRQTEPKLTFPSYMQGIDAFDADWDNLTVTNNVIVTSSCYTMGLASVHNSLIAGNTGLHDGLIATPGCTASLIVGGKTHEGLISSNTRVTNNLVERLQVNDQNTPTVTFDHNTALNSYQPIVHYDGKGWTYNYPRGTDANGNVAPVASTPYTSVFQKWSPSTGEYDLRILPDSPTITRTANGQIPASDIDGIARGGAVTPGAYGIH